MPDVDVIAIWKGHGYEDRPNALWDSKARVRIWRGYNDSPTFVVMSDLDEEGTGTSITNSSPGLATKIRREFGLKGAIIGFEHYPRHNQSERFLNLSGLKEEVSQVSYEVNNRKYCKSRWVYVHRETAESLIGGSLDMSGYQSIPEHRFFQ
jgi:hypothetical protein